MAVLPICRFPNNAILRQKAKKASRIDSSVQRLIDNMIETMQQAIYEFVSNNGKVTREEILANFDMKETELQMHLATLRHCELVKGLREGNSIYLVPFDYSN